jgi:hypothetical protein
MTIFLDINIKYSAYYKVKKMRLNRVLAYICISSLLLISCNRSYSPLGLHPENPHYFLFQGRPTVLIGSTEHYGSVLNRDFNYTTYLDELAAKNLNVTRTFSGIYHEPHGAFGIEKNTLAPAQGKLICPWARSNQPGSFCGGNKFDLTLWDEAYFKRLKNFVAEAGKRNIVVELDLFSNFYDTLQWKLCPLYIENNINQIGDITDQKEILSLKHSEILDVQEKMVRKIVLVLKDFDNLYYEVCNEPYFGDTVALDAWEQHMTRVIADAEKDFRFKHLISQNIANGTQKIRDANPLVSIFNFHYAKPPLAVGMNYGLNKVIGDNETGFNGIENVNYRTEAWNFMVAGGGLFDNLDYSFTVGCENGSFEIPAKQPGGGGAELRKQFKILKDVLDETDFIHMTPSDFVVKNTGKDIGTRVMACQGKQYLIYVQRKGQITASSTITAELPEGNYTGEWIDTKTGERTKITFSEHPGGIVTLLSPLFSEDIALKIINPGK